MAQMMLGEERRSSWSQHFSGDCSVELANHSAIISGQKEERFGLRMVAAAPGLSLLRLAKELWYSDGMQRKEAVDRDNFQGISKSNSTGFSPAPVPTLREYCVLHELESELPPPNRARAVTSATSGWTRSRRQG